MNVVDEEVREGLTRRDALRAGVGVAGGAVFAGGLLGRAIDAAAKPAVVGAGPYGPLRAADANGVMLPAGFTSRIVARTGDLLGPHLYPFHLLPDGMGSYETDDGGFILVSNCEAPYIEMLWEVGAAAIRFDSNYNIVDAYPILKKTNINCAGGVTPWNTWLSCEEIETGQVWECDPFGEKEAVAHPAMGVFKHEAACVDPVGQCAYLTEDLSDGCLYRFRPTSYPDLSDGRLDVATVVSNGSVAWTEVPDPQFKNGVPTRLQVPGATTFKRSEGMWFDQGVVYFATTQDDRVYAYRPETLEMEVLYDGDALGDAAPLHEVDNVMVSDASGDLYACEDSDNLQVCIISAEGEAAPFAELPGAEHADSELTGPVFDPSGNRFYFASQRATNGGVIFEITGPFRRTRPEDPDPVDPRDTKRPNVKIRTLGKPTLRGLLKHGQPFRLSVSDESPPVDLEVKLVAKMKRNAGKGAREVTIGKLNTKIGKSGDKRIQVKVGSRFKDRLRKRHVTQAKLVVVATDKQGNRRKTVKAVRFT